jgi:transketolase
MRESFSQEITALAAADPRIVLITGDIGNQLWDEFKARFPNRWYNAGIAEQNMVSMATGLAASGLRPWVYAIAQFAVTRCLEQIRADVCYHNLPVTIVGVGGGLSYANLGPTHHATDDIAFLRPLPNIKIIVPCDPVETRLAMRAIAKQDGPCYLRLGKRGEPVLHTRSQQFNMGQPTILLSGRRAVLYACGPVAGVAVEAAKILTDLSVSTAALSWHTVKPLSDEQLRFDFKNYLEVAVIEEHGSGGLASAILEWLNGVDPVVRATFKCRRLLTFGTPDAFVPNVGGRVEALAWCGLTAENVVRRILE